MKSAPPIDEGLLQRLPLPMARLWRRAQNSKTALERHLAAFYLWEAGLKLLGSVAVVEFAHLSEHDAEVRQRLENLARPSLGHWWEFCRQLVPILATSEDPGFAEVRKVLLGKSRDDLPWAAGLDAALRQSLEGTSGARSTVRLAELFNRLVQYRNREIGHGAAGQRGEAFYQNMGRALLSGIPEVLACVDVLAGRRLIYVTDVRRQGSGRWLVEREGLTGETAKRLPPVEFAEAAELPRPQRVYVEQAAREPDAPPVWRPLHPLVLYEPERGETFFLNGCRGRRQAEYLSYQSGEVIKRRELESDQRELLAAILGAPVDDERMDHWAGQSAAEDPPEEEAPPSASRTLGEFEILSRIGRGGMGVVYRAWQPSLGRQVALKCLLRTGHAVSESRFGREIRALGRVEHPHVVKIFTAGAEGDQWFYAMELVEGTDLDAVCRHLSTNAPAQVTEGAWQAAVSTACEKTRTSEELLVRAAHSDDEAPLFESVAPRTLSEDAAAPANATTGGASPSGASYIHCVVELVRQTAEAAHALHRAGVVHRDIKPANIMLDADGANAVLMDLGLAQLADEAEGRLTRTRQFVGTLRYASPEQVLAAGALDCRTDVYSLGATLWELLTLRPMFGATEETPTPELMRRIQYEEPERIKRHNGTVPTDLEAIVARCLEKNPDHRYATAQELADDLLRWQQNKPVHARTLTWRYVTGKFLRRNRYRIAGAAGFLLLQAAVLALVLLYWRPLAGGQGEVAEVDDPVRALREGDYDKYNEWVNQHNAEVTRVNAETDRALEAERQRQPKETGQPPAVSAPSPDSEPLPGSNEDAVTTLSDAAAEIAGEIAIWLRSREQDAVSLNAPFYPNIYSTASGPGIVLDLTRALEHEGIQIVPRARYTLSGEIPPIPPHVGLLVVAKDFSGEAESFFAPISDAGSLAVYLGLTTSFPLADESKRTDAILESWHNPAAYLSGPRASAFPVSPYSIEVLAGDSREPKVPRDEDGMAFVALPQGEPFSARLVNDSPHEAAVELCIDGVNVFALSEVESYRKFGRMIIPARSAANIGGFYRSSNEQIPFAAPQPGQPLAPELPAPTAPFGQITAVFAAAWGENDPPPGDEPQSATRPATGAGPSVEQNYSRVVRRIGVPRAAVTVRWTTE